MYFCPIELVDKMTIAVREYSKQDVELVLDTMESMLLKAFLRDLPEN